MTSIRQVQSFDFRQIQQGQRAGGPGGFLAGKLPEGSETQLNQALSKLGLSDEDAAALKSDLQSTLKETFESGSFPPDINQLQDKISSVFSKYGLDANELAGSLPSPPGGGFPGAGRGGFSIGGAGGSNGVPDLLSLLNSNGSEDSDSEDSSWSSTTSAANSTAGKGSQSLRDQLNQLFSKISQGDFSHETTNFLMSGLVGFDAEA